MRDSSRLLRCSSIAGIGLLSLVVSWTCGCGTSAVSVTPASGITSQTQTSTPVAGQDTDLTVAISSAANDQLANYQLQLGSLTLTSQNGSKVSVFDLSTTQKPAEFIHTNAVADPLVTVRIPQGVYTSATLTFENPQFTFVTYGSSSVFFNTGLALGDKGFVGATVNVPTPITVAGNAMVLVLESEVPQSVQLSGSPQAGNFISSVTPIFALIPQPISSSATASSAISTTMQTSGTITSSTPTSNGGTLAIKTGSGTNVAIAWNSATICDGITSCSSITPGMMVLASLGVQSDGSLLATRVDVPDAGAKDMVTGPIFNVDQSGGLLNLVGEREEGQDFRSGFRSGGMALELGSNIVFRVFGGDQLPQNLPFAASFGQNSLVAGQNIAVTSQSIPPSGPYPTIDTATLLPQTIDGTVTAELTSGSYTVYQVSLASYDPLTQGGKIDAIRVYCADQTSLLNSSSVQVGTIVRFHGLVFSNQGSLAMLADSVNIGVSE